MPPSQSDVRHHRSLFLSDLHLGARGSRADLALRFLKANVAQTYVLVGDILELAHPRLARWSPAHQAVVDHLRAARDAGAELVYVRGNHDEAPDAALARHRLPVAPRDQAVHVAADGRRFLVVHGHGQEARLFRSAFLSRLGGRVDQLLRLVDARLRARLRSAGPDRRSVIERLLSLGNRCLYPRLGHERRLVALARDGGYDGVICGHYHVPGLHDLHGLSYGNCGDWMDSFTALAEDHEGRLTLVGGRAAFAAPAPALRPSLEAA